MTTTQFIKRIISRIRKRNVYQAIVKAVNETERTCDVEIEGGVAISDVQLTAVIDTLESPCWMSPKIGSVVTCATLEDNEAQAVVVKFSEVEKVVFNGGKKSELSVWSEVVKELQKVTERVDTLNDALKNATPVAQDGGVAYKTAIVTALNANNQKEDWTKETLTDTNIIH